MRCCVAGWPVGNCQAECQGPQEVPRQHHCMMWLVAQWQPQPRTAPWCVCTEAGAAMHPSWPASTGDWLLSSLYLVATSTSFAGACSPLQHRRPPCLPSCCTWALLQRWHYKSPFCCV